MEENLEHISLREVKELRDDILAKLSAEDKQRLADMSLEDFKKLLPPVAEGCFEVRNLLRLKLMADEENKVKEEPYLFNCRICGNKGLISKIEYSQSTNSFCEWLEPCKCQKIREQLWLMKESGLGRLIKDCRMDNYKTTESWQKAVKGYAEKYISEGYRQGRWFLITGQSGCGKTHICTAIVRELFRKLIPCVYMAWDSEVVELNAEVNEADKYNSHIGRFKRAPVLYIDDFFKATGKPTAGEIKRAKEILDFRLRERKPTIISSEMSVEEIIEIDTAVGGRVYQMAKDYCVNVSGKGKNYRLK